jgi:thiamine-phosphate pyrophosphorylase
LKPGLYAIVDIDACEARRLSPMAVAEGALEGGAAVVQLRAKALTTRPFLGLATEMAVLSMGYGVPFFVNDRLDLALAAGAGLHVGQDDLPVATIRSIAPSISIGLSTHTRDELEAAPTSQLAYVAFGPVFPTASKERPSPVVGLEQLAELASHARGIPLVAIGGISLVRVPQAIAAGATLVAAIAGLLPPAGEAFGLGATISAVAERVRAYDRAVRTS